jgi:hypothetical protein
MSWTDSEGVERGGSCNNCGADVEEEHHALCMRCFAEEMGWPAWRRRREEERSGARAVTEATGPFGACDRCRADRLLYEVEGERLCIGCRHDARRGGRP